MDYITLLLPLLLIIALFAGLVILKRRMFDDEPTQAPIPIPDIAAGVQDSGQMRATPAPAAGSGARPTPVPAAPLRPAPAPAGMPAANTGGDTNGVSLSPARLYPEPVLRSAHRTIFSRLIKALPGYVVLPRIAYDQFLEARDGTPSENTSLQTRAGQQLADFVICDRKLNPLLVCQVEDGSVLPARILEREKMLQRAGLRLLRWNADTPPDPAKLLNTVQTLEKLGSRAVKVSG